MTKLKIAIVGNAKLCNDFSKQIDSCDIVLRFNEANNYGCFSGYKTDILCIRNNGEPGIRFSTQKLISKYPRFPNLSEVWFPRNTENILDYS